MAISIVLKGPVTSFPKFTTCRTSEAYKRVTEAGFTIGEVQVTEEMGGTTVSCIFSCVCGKQEYLGFRIDTGEDLASHYLTRSRYLNGFNQLDVALMLEDFGALSPQHLRNDGYSEEEIKYIRRAYENNNSR